MIFDVARTGHNLEELDGARDKYFILLPKLHHSIAFSSMDTVSSQSTSHTLESLSKRAALVKPLRPGLQLIATYLLKALTSQMTAEEIQKWIAEKYPHYQYTKRQIRDFLRHGAKGENPIFMVVNKYRAK